MELKLSSVEPVAPFPAAKSKDLLLQELS